VYIAICIYVKKDGFTKQGVNTAKLSNSRESRNVTTRFSPKSMRLSIKA